MHLAGHAWRDAQHLREAVGSVCASPTEEATRREGVHLLAYTHISLNPIFLPNPKRQKPVKGLNLLHKPF